MAEESSPSAKGNAADDHPPNQAFAATQANLEIDLPPNDDRGYRYVRLTNGLECVLISDTMCDVTAAAMDVGVGSLADPENFQGCAHFCEHALFLGTEKYREEGAYSNYWAVNNGRFNAYTQLSNTNYCFEIAPEAFDGALDRFAGFFTTPLFDASRIEREVNVVNAEQNKNLQNDTWRQYQLRKHLASPQHPFHMFPVGSRESLWDAPRSAGRDPRAELIDWWKRMYCAKRMKLVLLAQESLDTLEGWVRERFEDVPVRTKDGQQWLPYVTDVMEENQLGQFVYAEPVTDICSLNITFPFPDQGPLYQTKPSEYISHLLGHRGSSSILSCLKRRGWANSIEAECQLDTFGFDLFMISIDLTPAGLEQYKNVALIVFNYIQFLRKSAPQELIFKEIKAISEIRFRFAERPQPAEYVSGLAARLQKPIPREKIISSQWLTERFDPVAVDSAVQLLDVRRSNIIVTAKSMPPGVGPLDQVEPIFGTRFRRDKMSEEFIDKVLNGILDPELRLPGPNLFIPENLEVDKIQYKEPVHRPVHRPILLRDTALSRLWHKKDDRFWTPSVNVFISFKSPLLKVSPRQRTLSRLYCDLFRDSITETIYDAELAGLKYSIEHGANAIVVKLVGYNDKLPQLAEDMLRSMRYFKIDANRFEIIKEELQKECKDFGSREPYHLLRHYGSYARAEHTTAVDVETFAREFFARLHIETLVHGNMGTKAAKALQHMVENVVSARPLSSSEKAGERSLLLPPSSEYVWKMPVPNVENISSACEYYCHVGNVEDDHLRPRLSLLARLAEQPIFDVLRTKEQLGYMVSSSTQSTFGSMGFQILIQSEYSAAYLETRIEAFLEHFRTYLEGMTEREFETTRRGLISTNLEDPKNLRDESSSFWNAINDGQYDFAKRFRDVEEIKQISKEEVMELLTRYIHPSSAIRSKLSIRMESQVPVQAQKEDTKIDCSEEFTSESPESSKKIVNEDPKGELGRGRAEVRESKVFIENISEWKADLFCGPAARPAERLVVALEIE